MLKSKEHYANPNMYIRAFFTHKGICTDFPIDPVYGSYIRLVTPSPDQPKSEHSIYNRPQFFFGSVSGCSRMFEVKDYVKALKVVDMLISALESSTREEAESKTVGINTDFGLSLNAYGDINFKLLSGDHFEYISGRVSGVRPDPFENRSRVIKCLIRLRTAIESIGMGRGPESDIIEVDGYHMTMLHRSDKGIRHPIIIRGRAFNKVVEGGSMYFTMNSKDQRFVFMQGKEIKAIDTVNAFMGLAGVLAEQVIEDDVDRVAPLTAYDSNMEYVNAKMVNWESGPRTHITLNSDRFPANTKFQYVYDRVEHAKLHRRLQQFVQTFTA